MTGAAETMHSRVLVVTGRRTRLLVQTEFLLHHVECHGLRQEVEVRRREHLPVLTCLAGAEPDPLEPADQVLLPVLPVTPYPHPHRSLSVRRADALHELLVYPRDCDEKGGACLAQGGYKGATKGVGARKVHGDAITNGDHRVDVLGSDVVHGEEGDESILIVELEVVANVQRVCHAGVVRAHHTFGIALQVICEMEHDSRSGGVNQCSTTARLDSVNACIHLCIRDVLANLQEFFPAIQLRTL